MPHSRRQLLAKAAIAASRVGISLLFQLDLAFDLVRQADAAERWSVQADNLSAACAAAPAIIDNTTVTEFSRFALIATHLEQIQMLSPVNHFARRSRPSRSALMVVRPRRDRYDDHRQRKNHREPKPETICGLCHLFPLIATNRNRRTRARRPAGAR